MKRKIQIIRNIEGGDLLETFLVSAAGSLLIIRFILSLSGYPQVGGHGLHIAHMLWGGLFMLIALISLLSFLGTGVQRFSSVIGGIGFGTFIDELGKFITSDNNYFFQPTIALVYILFLSLFFLFRFIERHRPLSKKEYLMNSLRMLEEIINNDVDEDEHRQIVLFLKNSDPKDPLTIQLKQLLKTIELSPSKPEGRFDEFTARVVRSLRTVGSSPVTQELLILFSIVQSIFSIISITSLVMFTIKHVPSNISPLGNRLLFVAWSQLLSTIISTTLLIIGIIMLKVSRVRAYFFLRYSILITILFTQFFSFYRVQFHALPTLILNIILFVEIEYLTNPHRRLQTIEDTTK